MDAIRDRIKEQAKNRRRKLLFGIIAVIVLIVIAVVIEANINRRPTDIIIEKSRISEEKAEFIPLKELDTNIIVVKATDGSYRIAFDDCIGCYIEYGVHGQYKNIKYRPSSVFSSNPFGMIGGKRGEVASTLPLPPCRSSLVLPVFIHYRVLYHISSSELELRVGVGERCAFLHQCGQHPTNFCHSPTPFSNSNSQLRVFSVLPFGGFVT